MYNNNKARKIICILGLTVRTDIPYYSQIVSIIGTIRSIRWNLDFTYFRKWILIGLLLGVMAGLGAIGVFLSVEFFT